MDESCTWNVPLPFLCVHGVKLTNVFQTASWSCCGLQLCHRAIIFDQSSCTAAFPLKSLHYNLMTLNAINLLSVWMSRKISFFTIKGETEIKGRGEQRWKKCLKLRVNAKLKVNCLLLAENYVKMRDIKRKIRLWQEKQKQKRVSKQKKTRIQVYSSASPKGVSTDRRVQILRSEIWHGPEINVGLNCFTDVQDHFWPWNWKIRKQSQIFLRSFLISRCRFHDSYSLTTRQLLIKIMWYNWKAEQLVYKIFYQFWVNLK